MGPSAQGTARLGVFGGSGLYEMDGVENRRSIAVDTPFGAPSDDLVLGRIGGLDVAFLARHGQGHTLMPTEINYRANVYAMKTLGVEFLVSASAVGSLTEEVEPLHVVVPDQFIDRTRHRSDTFFGGGLVAHVSLADPFCAELCGLLASAARDAGAVVHEGGTYVCMEGPQFSTRAESELYRSWGARVIGMTNLQEARLSREAEICFGTLALVTDFDCWKTDEDPVSVEAIIDRLHRNAALAQRAIRSLAGRLAGVDRGCPCATALTNSIITSPRRAPAQTLSRLEPIVRRALGQSGA